MTLKNVNFQSPWTIISTLSALIGFVLLIIQTVYGVYGYYLPRRSWSNITLICFDFNLVLIILYSYRIICVFVWRYPISYIIFMISSFKNLSSKLQSCLQNFPIHHLYCTCIESLPKLHSKTRYMCRKKMCDRICHHHEIHVKGLLIDICIGTYISTCMCRIQDAECPKLSVYTYVGIRKKM